MKPFVDFSIQTNEGSYDIEAYVRFIGDSLLVDAGICLN